MTEQLLISDPTLRSLMFNMPGPISLWNASGEPELMNRLSLDYFGKTFEELRHSKEVLHPDDYRAHIVRWESALSTGIAFEEEARLLTGEGAYHWNLLRWFPIEVDSRQAPRWCLIQTDIHSLKEWPDKQRFANAFLESMIDGIGAPFMINSSNGNPKAANRLLLEYSGKTLEEIKNWQNNDFIHPGDRQRGVDAWEYSVTTGKPSDFEARRRRADGAYRWWHSHGFPLRDAGGTISHWCVIHTDIEDRKQMEARLLASEQSLKQIIDSIPGMAWSADKAGNVDFFSQCFVNYVGIPLEELTSGSWEDAVHPEDIGNVLATWKKFTEAAATPGEVEARLRRADGSYRWFLMRRQPLRDETGIVRRWYGLNTDIEDLKRAEEALATSERNLDQIINTMPAMAWSAYVDGAAEFVNQTYLEYVGLSLEEVQGWGWTSAVHPDDLPRLAAGWRTILESKRVGELEARMKRHDGAYRWFLLRASPLHGEDGEVMRWFGVNTDIEDRKGAEEAMRDIQSELAHLTRVMTMGQLTASIAHELNQPLSGIITNAETCLRMLSADPPNVSGAMETARRTIRDGNRASEVITRLRTLFKKKTAITETVGLNTAARDVLALAAAEAQRHKIRINAELSADLPPIRGDRVQLQQVMLNLVLNAVQATRGAADEHRHVAVSTSNDEFGQVRFSVKDYGVGFDPDAIEKLFSPFYTTKSDGMGIGLSVSNTIIKGHGGVLWAELNNGPGSTFQFMIPANGADQLEPSALMTWMPAPGSTRPMDNR